LKKHQKVSKGGWNVHSYRRKEKNSARPPRVRQVQDITGKGESEQREHKPSLPKKKEKLPKSIPLKN